MAAGQAILNLIVSTITQKYVERTAEDTKLWNFGDKFSYFWGFFKI